MDTETINKKEFDNLQKNIHENRMNKIKGGDKHKHEIVNSVMGVLFNNDISCYLFAALPHPNYPEKLPAVYQFNTLSNKIQWDDKGNLTLKSMRSNSDFHASMFVSIINYINTNIPQIKELGLSIHNPDDIVKLTQACGRFLYTCIVVNNENVKEYSE
jgi:hypothetical protein